MDVSVVRAEVGHATLRVVGHLHARNIELLTAVLEHQLAAGRRFVSLDMSAAVVADRETLAELLPTHEQMREVRGLLVLAGVTPALQDLLRTSRLDRVLFSTSEPATSDSV